MEFLNNYLLFLAKTGTLTLAIIFVIAIIASLKEKLKHSKHEGELIIEKINDKYDDMRESLNSEILTKEALKKKHKEQKKAEKKQKKKEDTENKPHKNIFILNFNGDIRATEVDLLREEVTAILTVATEKDEVFVRLESGGGLVHSYGLAASQLQRIRDKKIPLTISVDQVAASGGYLMASVGNKILAAPFAILGSIGVLAQIPNFHRLLKKHDIDFEQITAGEYKRTLTMFGENTEKSREKFKEEIEEVHHLFKDFVQQNRPELDIDTVATGEYWHGQQALALKLVDDLITSDDYLLRQSEQASLYEVKYEFRRTLTDKLSHFAETALYKVVSLFNK